MPEKIAIEEIRKELQALRGEFARIGEIAISFAKAHSDWSAHARWSSGCSALLGQFDLSTSIGLPTTSTQLDKIISETTSTRFLEVAKSLKDMLIEKK